MQEHIASCACMSMCTFLFLLCRVFVIHDSFRLDEWVGFMRGCPGVALDTHVYQAWFDIRSEYSFLEDACSWRWRIQAMQTPPLLIGEWSLATDNCQMWLNGFHDNAPGYPKLCY